MVIGNPLLLETSYFNSKDLKFLQNLDSKNLIDLLILLNKKTEDYFFDSKIDLERIISDINSELTSKYIIYKEFLVNILLNISENYKKEDLLKWETEEIENELFINILTNTLKIMSLEKLNNLSKSLNLNLENEESTFRRILNYLVKSLNLKKKKIISDKIIDFLKNDFKENGFISYQLSLIITISIIKLLRKNIKLYLASNIELIDIMSILKKPLNKTINNLIVKKKYKTFFKPTQNPPISFPFLFPIISGFPYPFREIYSYKYKFFSDKSIIPFVFTLATLRKKYEYEKNEKKYCYNELAENIKTNNIKFIELMYKLKEKYDQTHSILEKEMENFAKEAPNILEWKDISKAVKENVNIEELIDRRPIKSKKRSPIRRFIHQNTHQLSNYIIDYFLNTPKTVEILNNYKNSIAPILNEIEKITKETPTIYIPESTHSVNIFVERKDMPAKILLKDTKEEIVYYPVEIYFDRIVEEYEFNVDKLSLPKGSLYPIVTEIFEKEISKREKRK